MGTCKTHSFFPSFLSFSLFLAFSCRYRSITFFFLSLSFSVLPFFFQIRHTYDRKRSVLCHDVECIYIYGLIPFFLSVFFVCFGSHCTISIVRVRMTLTGGRRFLLLRFFFSNKVHLFSTFLSLSLSLSSTRSLTMTMCVSQKKKEIKIFKVWMV